MIIEESFIWTPISFAVETPKLAYKLIYIFEMHQRTNQMKYNNDKSRVYH